MTQDNTKGAAPKQGAPAADRQNPSATKTIAQTKTAEPPARPAGSGQPKPGAPASGRRSGNAPAGQGQGKAPAPTAQSPRPPAGNTGNTGRATGAGSTGKPAGGGSTGKPVGKTDGRPGGGGPAKGAGPTPAGQRQGNAPKASPGSPVNAGPERPAPPGARPTNGTPAGPTRPGSQTKPGATQSSAPSQRAARPTSAPAASNAPRGGGQPAQAASRSAGNQGQPARPAPAGSRGGNGHNGGGKSQQRSAMPPKGQAVPTGQPTASAGARAAPAAAPAITEIIIGDHITVRELAEKMHRSAIDVIKALMNYGIMVPITQTIDFDTAQVVGGDLGITVNREAPPEPVVVEVKEEAPKTLRQQIIASEKPEEMVIRPPIVTVLGHVDHGKTTLLDAIRETRVVDGEAGGITQHIGAYQVERQGRKITFLDTPGHEAFTAMRARGAMVTDIAVLVVAADDGVMPQTKEAIAHARAARVPIVVALNKIDKPAANPDRVKQELVDNDLLIEEYGGDVICVPVSAKFRRGIDDLLENLLLVADIDPLKANPAGNCIGTVIESRMDKSRGPLATLLVQNGTLRVGDSIVAGDVYGKMRALYDDKGQPITEALPATPVVVFGMADVAAAGDTFAVEADERAARAIAAERQAKRRAETIAAAAPKAVALENIFAQAQTGQVKELNLILKCDVQGSLEPIVNSLEKLGDEKLHVKILHQATGNINESDVMLAVASKAIILGFNVITDIAAQRMAETEGVDVRTYNIIYNIVEDIEKALKGMLAPVYKEVVLGHAEVRAIFRITKVGKVAGCYVTDGEIQRGASVRVKRGGEVVRDDRIGTLKRFQEDATEVKSGFECGLSLNNYNELEVGDVLEAYKKERVN
jgi:translation initiation factor IF-2